jgi:hypothetical protein
MYLMNYLFETQDDIAAHLGSVVSHLDDERRANCE